jgi:glycine betaine/choline ABC-type transport system substrate-binding protein
MKSKNYFIALIFIMTLSMMAQSIKVNAQQKDTVKVATDTSKVENFKVKHYAIDGVIVTEKEFLDRKDGLAGLAAYPGIVFDPKFTGMVMMKISKVNEQSEAVQKLKQRAKELGLHTTRIERGN